MRAASYFIFSVYCAIVLFAGRVSADGGRCILDSTDIEIRNNLTARIRVHKIIEITSENGSGLAEISVPVNDYMKIEDIEGYTLLPGGRKVKIKSSDIRSASTAQIREFGGYRVVLINMRSPVIGAQLHYRYTLKLKSLLYLPRFIPDSPYDTDRYVIRVTWQDRVGLRYDAGGFQIDTDENEIRFHIDNIPGAISAANSCPGDYYVYLSADNFKYGRHKYISNTWSDVGRFFRSLSAQPARSLEKTAALARRIVGNSSTRKDSIEAIFDYVADSVAYVSLEMGKSDFDPHTCDLIIERRFGDCKDQAILLSALYGQIGLESYPILVATGNYPLSDSFHPWPSLFDHAAVMLFGGGEETIILDPSDPQSVRSNSTTKLRGNYFLVTDGSSDLRRVPLGPEPAQRIIWNFDIGRTPDDSIGCDFTLEYYNAAAAAYRKIIGRDDAGRLVSGLRSMLFQSEWHVSSMEAASLASAPDTLVISGGFTIGEKGSEAFDGISVGSPILEYLLKIFSGIRSVDYCTRDSYELEEAVRVEFGADGPDNIERYHEVWVLENLEFSDQISLDGTSAIYRRTFKFDGTRIPRDDYNAFRDFIFSMRDQRYIHVWK